MTLGFPIPHEPKDTPDELLAETIGKDTATVSKGLAKKLNEYHSGTTR
jgi:hypothetical protein